MAPKKKPAPKGKEDGPDPFEEFVKKYTKNQKEFDTPKIAEAQQIITTIQEEEETPGSTPWNFSQEFDPMAFRVLWHSLRQSTYPSIRAIRLWKCGGGDESVRSVCYYLDMEPSPTVEDVQFTDNGVTPLGCEFLGRTLGPTGNKIINFLRLDYNKFGAAGVEQLSMGLAQSATLRVLSLQYCDIGEEGGTYLAHILMFIKSSLEDLRLRGNCLGDRGAVEVFAGARRAKNLLALDVFDNKFTVDKSKDGKDGTPGPKSPEVIDSLRELFSSNTKLAKYDLGGNYVTGSGAAELITAMTGQSHLKQVLIPERCGTKAFEALEIVLGSGKKGKKGKGKGKKGKK